MFGFTKRFDDPSNWLYFAIHNNGNYVASGEEPLVSQQLPNASIPDNASAVIGCGLMKHLGQRKIFYTKDGQLLGK